MATSNDDFLNYVEKEIIDSPGEYVPRPFYEPELDCLIFYERDVPSYSKRLNATVSLILDGSNDELIGVKIKGVQRILRQMERLQQRSKLVYEDDKLQLWAFLRMALVVPIDDPALSPYEEALDRFDEVEVDRGELVGA